MDPTHILITIDIAVGVLGFVILGIILSRDLRTISRSMEEISHIQRALFLMLRRQYGDIERDLQEIRDLLKA
jgi:hypothetical protein